MASQKDMSEWMANLPSALQKVPLNQLAIPGSHDSGSYDLTTEMSPSASSALRFLASLPGYARLFGPTVLAIATCQTLTVGQQLEAGVRHFDFRVSSKPGKGDEVYFVHSVFGTKVRTGLSAINDFLERHLHEVVVLDIQHFHNMTPAQHTTFIQLLKVIFGSRLCPRSDMKNLTLRKLWDSKQQVSAALSEMAAFLEGHPREVIVLDCQQFHDMTPAQHGAFVASLKKVFGSKLCGRMSLGELTLQRLWRDKKQVICIYQNEAASQDPDLWTSDVIQSPWPNVTSPEECVSKLTQYMDQAKEVKDKFFVCQGVLTPDTSYVLSHCGASVHKLTQKLNPLFTAWLAESPTKWKRQPNIVIHDFVQDGDYIQNVLALNSKRM